MIHLLKYEFYKVARKKLFWGMLAVALIFNIAAMWWINRPTDYSPTPADYRSLHTELRPLSNNEKLTYLESKIDLYNAISLKEQFETQSSDASNSFYSDSINDNYKQVYSKFKDVLDKPQDYELNNRRLELAENAKAELKTVMGYGDYLKTIRQNAEILNSTSIFASSADENIFSSRNIQKTVVDFASMDSINPQYDIAKGIKLITDSPISVLFTLIAILFICLSLITDEKDKGLFAIVKTTQRGSLQTITAKLITLFIFVLLVSSLFYGSSLIFAANCYGLGDLSRPVQSLPLMMSSILRLNVGQYLLLFFVAETLGLFIVSLIITLFAIISKSPVFILVDTFLVTAISVALYTFIPMSSDFNWFKIINPVSLVMSGIFLNNYFNLNFFGLPINLLVIAPLFIASAIVILSAANCLIYSRKKEFSTVPLSLRTLLPNARLLRTHIHRHFWFYEIKKSAVINRAALILVIFAIFQWYSYKDAKIYMSPDDYYYKQYMTALDGQLTSAKENFINKEKQTIDDARNQVDKLDFNARSGVISQQEKSNLSEKYEIILLREPAFSQVYSRYQYIKVHPDTQFIYDTGYENIFGISEKDSGVSSGIRMLIVMILCLCGVFSIEYRTGMFKVLGSTRYGISNTIVAKIAVSGVITLISFILTYLPELWLIGKTYGYAGLFAPISSLPQFEYFGTSFSVLGVLILLLAARFAVCFFAMVIILALSSLIKNNVYTAIIAFTLLVFPLLWNLLEINILNNISILPLITTHQYFLSSLNAMVKLAQISIFTAITAMSIVFLRKKFCRN